MASLRAFGAVAQTKSLSAAGRELNVTHAAISQQIKSLEAHLGLLLVQREGRGVALTPEGLKLSEGLNEGFSRIAETIEALSKANANRPLSITMTPTFAVSWLMPRISDFREKHPDIELMLNPTASLVTLEPGGVDLAIRYGDGDWPGLEAELLLPSNYVVVGATCLVGDAPAFKPQDLLQFPWLQELGINELSLWLQQNGVVAETRPNVTELPGYMILDGVRRGHGITVMPKVFVLSEVEAGTLRVLFEDIRSEGSGYYIVSRPGVIRPPAKTFISWLRAHCCAPAMG
ncbi:LysR family transcriptional regulator [Roseibium hamelinense]|uniref:LysR family transcriptional regulator n=1 Tax=Roseibium hamelinense TaxID=150831 RepID=UPI001AD91889|nr:LysR family transcriptional regulator [Roseibium hamelinense]